MTPHNELRLLPWPGPEGKPCFLSTDDNSGHLSRLADSAEAVQLGVAAELGARLRSTRRRGGRTGRATPPGDGPD